MSFKVDPNGKTFIDRQYATYPFHICRALYLDELKMKGMATVYTQSSSGGLYTKDKLNMKLHLKENIKTHLTTQASTIVHKNTNGPTLLKTTILCDRNSFFEYMPEPLILLPGAELTTSTKITASNSSIIMFLESFLTHDFLEKNRTFSRLSNELIIQDTFMKPFVIDRFSITGEEFRTYARNFSSDFCCHSSLIIFCPKHTVNSLLSEFKKFSN